MSELANAASNPEVWLAISASFGILAPGDAGYNAAILQGLTPHAAGAS